MINVIFGYLKSEFKNEGFQLKAFFGKDSFWESNFNFNRLKHSKQSRQNFGVVCLDHVRKFFLPNYRPSRNKLQSISSKSLDQFDKLMENLKFCQKGRDIWKLDGRWHTVCISWKLVCISKISQISGFQNHFQTKSNLHNSIVRLNLLMSVHSETPCISTFVKTCPFYAL